MYGLTRATVTLIGAALAGLLIWLATHGDTDSTGGYWAVYGLLAGAGLTMALSQLFGGWTKWGWPRISGSVFLLGFLPVLIAAGWVLLAAQPDDNWFESHVGEWSDDLGIVALVDDLAEYLGVLAFGVGLVFGFTFDTSGPRRRVVAEEDRPPVATATRPPARERAPSAADAETAERRGGAATELPPARDDAATTVGRPEPARPPEPERPATRERPSDPHSREG